MPSEDLKEKLRNVNSSRKNREDIAAWVIQNPDYIKEILQFYLTPKNELLVKSAWLMEIVCIKNTSLFITYAAHFFEHLPTIKNDSALRSCAKICEVICSYKYSKVYGVSYSSLKENQRQLIVECCFDWLLTNQKVACEAPAMQCLYYLGKDADKAWIYPELKDILLKNSIHKSAGYQARAKKILKLIV